MGSPLETRLYTLHVIDLLEYAQSRLKSNRQDNDEVAATCNLAVQEIKYLLNHIEY